MDPMTWKMLIRLLWQWEIYRDHRFIYGDEEYYTDVTQGSDYRPLYRDEKNCKVLDLFIIAVSVTLTFASYLSSGQVV